MKTTYFSIEGDKRKLEGAERSNEDFSLKQKRL
jgi:hypothetical protein